MRSTTVLFICVLIGCSQEPKTPTAAPAQEKEVSLLKTDDSASAPVSTDSSEVDGDEEPTDFPLVSAVDLAKEFLEDEEAAIAKYEGKSILIYGTAVAKLKDGEEFRGNDKNGSWIAMEGYKGENETLNIVCGIYVPESFNELLALNPGDRVKVRAQFSGRIALPFAGWPNRVARTWQGVIIK